MSAETIAPIDIPRVVIAGVSSGTGKTTVTVGLCRALRARGLRVALFKCGPDYLDPTYHRRAAGGPSHNLDGWMMGREAVRATFQRASHGADIALIEGVMGLFDGASPTGDEGSTAEIAKWLDAPVLLVADAGGMARSLAALVAGFAGFDRGLRFAGVICNRVGSRGHLDLLKRALTAPPIVGGLPREPELAFPERHLGLLTAREDAVAESLFAAWGARASEWLDLDAILEIARVASSLVPVPSPPSAADGGRGPERTRIALALDEAFHFYYDDNLRRLEALGAELVPFSPVRDAQLPPADGLYLGGGYPELHAEALAANSSMRDAVTTFARSGRPIYAECGGLMYLTRAIRTRDGRSHAMVGLFPCQAVMADRLEALGYVEVALEADTPIGPAGTRFRGHQFRYSRLTEADGAIALAYSVRRRRGQEAFREGYRAGDNVLASYVHAHWASNPRVAEAFVASCAAARARGAHG
jgi:cobyrinic acid a,c-diamide synthase